MKRRIATAIGVIGIALVGSQLARVWPRTVEITYVLDPGVVGLDVDYLQDDQAVASARFKQPDAKTTAIRQAVRLQPGAYQIRITVYRSDGHEVEHVKTLAVPTEGPTRFDLKAVTTRSP